MSTTQVQRCAPSPNWTQLETCSMIVDKRQCTKCRQYGHASGNCQGRGYIAAICDSMQANIYQERIKRQRGHGSWVSIVPVREVSLLLRGYYGSNLRASRTHVRLHHTIDTMFIVIIRSWCRRSDRLLQWARRFCWIWNIYFEMSLLWYNGKINSQQASVV
jgi:hypothetical protein